MYASPALALRSRQIQELNVCWKNVIRRLFSYNKWESVKTVLLGLGLLNITHLIMLRKMNFYRHAFLSENNVMCTIFMSFLKNNCGVMLKSVFMFKSAAVNMVHISFELYASSDDWCLILLHVFTFLASVVYSCSLSFLYHSWWINVFITIKPVNLAALKVSDFACKIILAWIISENSSCTIPTRVMPIKLGTVSIFMLL